jgi:hypothetical protein
VGAAAVLAGIQLAQFGFVDAPDVADGVDAERLQRIAAGQVGLDIHPGNRYKIDGQPGDFLVGQLEAQRRPRIRRIAARQFAEPLDVGVGELDALPNRRQGGVQILALLRRDFEMVGGEIVGQQHPVAVVDETTGRRQRLQRTRLLSDRVVKRSWLSTCR